MSRTVFLDSGSASIQHLCRKDKRFAKLFSMIGPISYTTYEDGYAFLVQEVIEQMISPGRPRKFMPDWKLSAAVP